MRPATVASLLLISCVISGSVFAEQPVHVTVHQLLAHPKEFVGKRVDVTGYCDLSTEEISLHASKRAQQQSQGCDSSIWLEVSTPPVRNAARDEDLSFKTVRVIGTFRYHPNPIDMSVPYERRFRGFGTYKMWAREISDITFLQPVR